MRVIYISYTEKMASEKRINVNDEIIAPPKFYFEHFSKAYFWEA